MDTVDKSKTLSETIISLSIITFDDFIYIWQKNIKEQYWTFLAIIYYVTVLDKFFEANIH